jgi:hypothetical protein
MISIVQLDRQELVLSVMTDIRYMQIKTSGV